MLKQVYMILIREFNYLWRDKGLRNIILFAPLIGVAIFGFTYTAQTINAIPTAILDLDYTNHSRELVAKFAETEQLRIAAEPNSYEELEKILEKGEVVVGIVIPENYGQDISLNRQTRVLTVIDGTNMIFATNANVAVTTINKTISAEAGIKTLMANNMSMREAKEAYMGAELREEGWYNPTMNYAYFLVLALILNIWQQVCTLVASINIIGETGVPSWIQFQTSGFSKLRLFVVKSIAHITIFMLLVMPLYWLAFKAIKLPLHCSFGELLLFTFVFAIAVHSVGTMMSSIATNAVDSARFGMMVALPSFVLSGYTWPIESMPAIIQPVVKALPQTWFFQGFNSLTFKDASWSFMSQYYINLLLITIVCYAIATLVTAWLEGIR